ncbi:hypothetical protein YC2023_030675 [Brassica napus]
MEDSSKGLTKGAWTAEEDSLLRRCIDKYGEGKWHQIPLRAVLLGELINTWLHKTKLPGRTANDIKNYWNTHLSKKHEPCCKTKMKKRNVTFSSTTPAQKIDVFKPRPRLFTVNNGCSHLHGLPEVDVVPPCVGLNNINNVCENSMTCNKAGEKYELFSNLMDGENMWWESLLEQSKQPDGLVPKGTATKKGATFAFDVEQLWNMLDGETVELD